ncbi:hypothetical protein ACOCJ4_15100 [Knoellia sp. CPCC 206435]|uniref:hypothetical protein n=1 Tax=Knoellia terrae TaxID=3404797 RepID=UPI003B42E257
MDRVAGWLDGSDPRTTRRVSWGAVAAIAIALAWPTPASDGSQRHPTGRPSVAAPAQGPAVATDADPACAAGAGPSAPRPAGLARYSTGQVGASGVVESTRWGVAGSRGLWGVAEVADCGAVRLDAVWFGPTGQKHRYRISPPGQPEIGVVANSLDGAISVYGVRALVGGGFTATLHISTDWGLTWQEREVPPSAEEDVRAGALPAQWRQWPTAAG